VVEAQEGTAMNEQRYATVAELAELVALWVAWEAAQAECAAALLEGQGEE
jgi:hypothetical protein